MYTAAQLCLTLCDPVDCSLPGSSVHGIFQARILEWVAISYSRGSSQPRDWTWISCISCIGRQVLFHCATWVTFTLAGEILDLKMEPVSNRWLEGSCCVAQGAQLSALWRPAGVGGELMREGRCVYVEQIHFAVQRKLRWRCKALYSNDKIKKRLWRSSRT